jgi:hypothetical protein
LGQERPSENPHEIVRPEDLKSFPPIREYSDEEIKEAYALGRASFTIEDLLRYTELPTDEVPAEQVLKEMEETQSKHDHTGR